MNSLHEYGRQKSDASCSVSRWLAYFIAILITFTVVDFFSVKKSSHEDSFDNFNRLFANSYPQCIPSGIGDLFDCLFRWPAVKSEELEETKKPEVSAVVWTDRMLQELNEAWPLDMEYHANVLHTILQYEPKAVLVDFLFLDDPAGRGDSSLEELLDVICDHWGTSKKETVARVYFHKPKESELASELTEGLMRECDLVLENPPEDQVVQTEDQVVQTADQVVQTAPAHLAHSPSRIYPQDSSAVEVFSGITGKTMEKRDFRLFWAGRPSPVSKRFFECREASFPNNMGEVVLEVAEPLWKRFLSSDESEDPDRKRLCPYIPMLPASVLYCFPPMPLGEGVSPGPGWRNVVCARKARVTRKTCVT